MIAVRKNVGMIEISFPYNPDHIAKIKAIEGCHIHVEHSNQRAEVLLWQSFEAKICL